MNYRSADLGPFSEEQVSRARRYHRPLYTAATVSLILDCGALALIVFSPLSGRLFAPFEHWPWWAAVIGLTAVVAGVRTLVGLPISFWAGFSRERSWGFSTQSLAGWMVDVVKGFGLALLLTAAALTLLVGSARLFPSMWPLVAAAAGTAMVLTLGFSAPVVIEPLFNRFTPLTDVELATQLQAVAERAQVPVKTVLDTDASRRTRKTNATSPVSARRAGSSCTTRWSLKRHRPSSASCSPTSSDTAAPATCSRERSSAWSAWRHSSPSSGRCSARRASRRRSGHPLARATRESGAAGHLASILDEGGAVRGASINEAPRTWRSQELVVLVPEQLTC
jgi:hypothetical protein